MNMSSSSLTSPRPEAEHSTGSQTTLAGPAANQRQQESALPTAPSLILPSLTSCPQSICSRMKRVPARARGMPEKTPTPIGPWTHTWLTSTSSEDRTAGCTAHCAALTHPHYSALPCKLEGHLADQLHERANAVHVHLRVELRNGHIHLLQAHMPQSTVLPQAGSVG